MLKNTRHIARSLSGTFVALVQQSQRTTLTPCRGIVHNYPQTVPPNSTVIP